MEYKPNILLRSARVMRQEIGGFIGELEGFFHGSAVEVVKLEREQVVDALDAEDLAIGTK